MNKHRCCPNINRVTFCEFFQRGGTRVSVIVTQWLSTDTEQCVTVTQWLSTDTEQYVTVTQWLSTDTE